MATVDANGWLPQYYKNAAQWEESWKDSANLPGSALKKLYMKYLFQFESANFKGKRYDTAKEGAMLWRREGEGDLGGDRAQISVEAEAEKAKENRKKSRKEQKEQPISVSPSPSPSVVEVVKEGSTKEKIKRERDLDSETGNETEREHKRHKPDKPEKRMDISDKRRGREKTKEKENKEKPTKKDKEKETSTDTDKQRDADKPKLTDITQRRSKDKTPRKDKHKSTEADKEVDREQRKKEREHRRLVAAVADHHKTMEKKRLKAEKAQQEKQAEPTTIEVSPSPPPVLVDISTKKSIKSDHDGKVTLKLKRERDEEPDDEEPVQQPPAQKKAKKLGVGFKAKPTKGFAPEEQTAASRKPSRRTIATGAQLINATTTITRISRTGSGPNPPVVMSVSKTDNEQEAAEMFQVGNKLWVRLRQKMWWPVRVEDSDSPPAKAPKRPTSSHHLVFAYHLETYHWIPPSTSEHLVMPFDSSFSGYKEGLKNDKDLLQKATVAVMEALDD
eukprot:TRINITY_DN35623_c0_g1_i1.p1 TRINITY_DN35623_c0_g1~~TRINITY_DN35623_c0_g1_i1.p1  ORF type:complete len:552 (+),score=82.34 TRINITY_DN35623_c0_g1_i1:148-1656(+)